MKNTWGIRMLAGNAIFNKGRPSVKDNHFTVERGFYLSFVSSIDTVGYTVIATVFRKVVLEAVEDAERKTKTVLLAKENMAAFQRKTNRKLLRVKASKTGPPIVQIHVYLNAKVQTAFLHAIRILGYSSVTEFFREKMRLTINNIELTIGSSLGLAQERISS